MTIHSIQNVVEVGSQLLESNNHPLWEQLTEVTMTTQSLFSECNIRTLSR